jgi:hypothetical protein
VFASDLQHAARDDAGSPCINEVSWSRRVAKGSYFPQRTAYTHLAMPGEVREIVSELDRRGGRCHPEWISAGWVPFLTNCFSCWSKTNASGAYIDAGVGKIGALNWADVGESTESPKSDDHGAAGSPWRGQHGAHRGLTALERLKDRTTITQLPRRA